MPSYKVKVKWGRENYPNIDVNTDEEPLLFKAQLFALTGVQPERQKVMCKGLALKDGEWNIQLKDGAVILLLGTKDELAAVPVEIPKFIEDMNETELASALELPPGMTNLGNTCYMNATVQCLRAVPELRNAVRNFREEAGLVDFSGASPASSIVNSLKTVFAQMDGAVTVNPVVLLHCLHLAFPQFAQTGENGVYRQQDANECWGELLRMLQQKLPAIDAAAPAEPTVGAQATPKKHGSLIEQYFGGTFDAELKCADAPEEAVSRSQENFLQLSCFISQEVKYMHSGLRSKLQEQITKQSPSLGRDAVYTKTSLISRLPAYLTVNFVRFQFKGKEGINAKILKDIKFPIDFDAFELCTPALQERLVPMRSAFKEHDDAELARQAKLKEQHRGDTATKTQTVARPYSFAEDLGSNNSGFYTLRAVLTHQGRSSSSGHYVGWVRQKNDKWMKFDDDVVSSVDTDDVLRLSGGGDWHCAYVLLYGPRILEASVESATPAAATDGADAATRTTSATSAATTDAGDHPMAE